VGSEKLAAKFDAAVAGREGLTWGGKEVGECITSIMREDNSSAPAPYVPNGGGGQQLFAHGCLPVPRSCSSRGIY